MRLAYLSGAVGLFAALLPCSVASAREPTEFEQYMLERMNFARANPLLEIERLAGEPWGDDGNAMAGLNEGLPTGTISSDPKQPLAFNLNLIDAASDYSDTLLANGAFGHNFGGTDIGSRIQSAGYSFVPSAGAGENLAVTASSIRLPITRVEVDEHHGKLLFIDGGVSGRGHRKNIMNPAWREVGVGIRTSDSYAKFACCPNAVLTTQDFAFTSAPGGGPFITGVAYRDVDRDEFYTPAIGEALGGLDVDVLLSGTDTLVASTTTLLGGGYKVGGFDAGTYDVRFTGPNIDETYRSVVFDGTFNLKIDAIDPGFTSLAADLTRNGFVDFEDLTVLLANWNKQVGAEAGNLVMPNKSPVNFDDLTVLLAAWTGPGPAGAPPVALSTTAVPEPSTAVLGLIAALGVGGARRRRRCKRRRSPGRGGGSGSRS